MHSFINLYKVRTFFKINCDRHNTIHQHQNTLRK